MRVKRRTLRNCVVINTKHEAQPIYYKKTYTYKVHALTSFLCR